MMWIFERLRFNVLHFYYYSRTSAYEFHLSGRRVLKAKIRIAIRIFP